MSDVDPDVFDMCQDYEVLLVDILAIIDPKKKQQVTQAKYDEWVYRYKYAGFSPEELEELEQEREAIEAFKYGEWPHYLIGN